MCFFTTVLFREEGNTLVAKKKRRPVHKFGAFSKLKFDACAAKLGTRRVAIVSKELSAQWKALDQHEQEQYAAHAEMMNIERTKKQEHQNSKGAKGSTKGKESKDLNKTLEDPSKPASCLIKDAESIVR